MKLLSVVDGFGIQLGMAPRGSPTAIQAASAATTGVARSRRLDGCERSAANSCEMARHASDRATPASRYRERYQNGRTRAFQRRPWGASTNTAPDTVAIPNRKRPVRRLNRTERMAPATAMRTMRRRLLGLLHRNRFLLYSVSFSQPMLLTYGRRR